MTTDDELLSRLQRALLTHPEAEPPQASIVALHRAVGRPAATRRPIRLVTAAAFVVSSLTLTTAAFAVSGRPLPRVVREVASTIGLPVDSPALTDARDHRRELREALDSGTDDAVAEAAARLQADLAALDAHDRNQIEPEAAALLAKADTPPADDHSDEPAAATPLPAPPKPDSSDSQVPAPEPDSSSTGQPDLSSSAEPTASVSES
jgi:hypothetical protein